MRIIAGTYRSRMLDAPPGWSIRPSSGRLRETLFNVLAPRTEGAAFLDLYAGSGAVGLEALSRGAAPVAFVELDRAALKILRGNMARLGIVSGVRVHAGSVCGFLRSGATAGPKAQRYDIVFLDPPYDAAEEYAASLAFLGGAGSAILAPGALVVAEHRRKLALDERYGGLERTRLLQQGDAALSFYAVAQTADE